MLFQGLPQSDGLTAMTITYIASILCKLRMPSLALGRCVDQDRFVPSGIACIRPDARYLESTPGKNCNNIGRAPLNMPCGSISPLPESKLAAYKARPHTEADDLTTTLESRFIMKQNQTLQSRYTKLTDLQSLLERLFGHDYLIDVCFDTVRAIGSLAESKTGAHWKVLLDDPSTAYGGMPIPRLRQRVESV